MCVACMSVSFDLASGFQGSPMAQWPSALQSFLWLNPVPLCGCGGGVLSGETPGRRQCGVRAWGWRVSMRSRPRDRVSAAFEHLTSLLATDPGKFLCLPSGSPPLLMSEPALLSSALFLVVWLLSWVPLLRVRGLQPARLL